MSNLDGKPGFNNDPEWIKKKAEQEDGCFVSVGGAGDRLAAIKLKPHVPDVAWLIAEAERLRSQVRTFELNLRSLIAELEEPRIAIQCRVCWHEHMADRPIPFSGRVQDFKGALAEVALKRGVYNFHGVHIECRTASDAAWPRAWDGPEGQSNV